jgi:hypothetical protein
MGILNHSHCLVVVLQKVIPTDSWFFSNVLCFQKLIDLVLRLLQEVQVLGIVLLEFLKLLEVEIDASFKVAGCVAIIL